MLGWMIMQGEIDAFFSKATVRAETNVLGFTFPFREEAGESFGAKMDAIIEREYEPELAAKLKGKDSWEKIQEDTVDWEEEDGPSPFDPGYFFFASEIGWDEGTLKVDWLMLNRDIIQLFFPTDEFLASEFDDPVFSVFLEGMAFSKASIEMMLPSIGLSDSVETIQKSGRPNRNIGRPRKWDWDAALAYVVAQAQTPDGLPTGYGAQARIETMMAEWFESETGSSPAVSQIRKRASTVMEMLERQKANS